MNPTDRSARGEVVSKGRVNGERLWDSLMTMAAIGATANGGVNRQTLTDEDRRGRELFRSWCEAAGLSVSVDRMGNMFARRHGQRRGAPAGAAGSHLDTQPTGGKFDGALRRAGRARGDPDAERSRHRTKAPLEVAVWTNEEGSRFAPGDDGIRRVRGRVPLDSRWRAGPGRQDVGEELARSATPATGRSAAGRSGPSSRRTSSRGRSWRPRAGASAS